MYSLFDLLHAPSHLADFFGKFYHPKDPLIVCHFDSCDSLEVAVPVIKKKDGSEVRLKDILQSKDVSSFVRGKRRILEICVAAGFASTFVLNESSLTKAQSRMAPETVVISIPA